MMMLNNKKLATPLPGHMSVTVYAWQRTWTNKNGHRRNCRKDRQRWRSNFEVSLLNRKNSPEVFCILITPVFTITPHYMYRSGHSDNLIKKLKKNHSFMLT